MKFATILKKNAASCFGGKCEPYEAEVRIGQEAEFLSLRRQVFSAGPHLEKRLRIPAEPLTKNRTLLTSAAFQYLVRHGYSSFFMIGNGRITADIYVPGRFAFLADLHHGVLIRKDVQLVVR